MGQGGPADRKVAVFCNAEEGRLVATDLAYDGVSPVVHFQRWSAVDVDTEERIDRDLRRPMSWRRALMRWLIEYNKY